MLIQFKNKAFKFFALSFMLLLFLAVHCATIVNAQTVEDAATDPSTIAPEFTNTADALIQQRELAAYVQANALSGRVAQVDLTNLAKISQYYGIDTSDSGYGYNACGLVAAAAALGGDEWTSLVGVIADAAGDDYTAYAGIQPSNYVAALQAVFGTDNVVAMNSSTLGDLYRALTAGKIVIVDIQVSAVTEEPSVSGPNFAHFARVLGMDVAKDEIYIENTLSGDAYWTLSLTDFVQIWKLPETSVSFIPDPAHAEPVSRWMVMLDNTAPAI